MGRFQNCKKCRCAHYFSRGCQKADWRRHRDNCESIGQAYMKDRRIQEDQKSHTPFGFGDVYKFCLWAHLIGRIHAPDAPTPDAREGEARRPRTRPSFPRVSPDAIVASHGQRRSRGGRVDFDRRWATNTCRQNINALIIEASLL